MLVERSLRMQVLVHAPEDFNNLCVLTRTLEALGVDSCHIFDPHRIVRTQYGKSYTRKLKTVSAGAFFHVVLVPVVSPLEFIGDYSGRTIATVPDQAATSLYEFGFLRDDLLVLGSEARGLPAEVIEACDVRLTIPQRGVTQSLNLCVASGIILAEWFRQMARGVGCSSPAGPTASVDL
jgi:tRNA G18 (ribose-2'-O)-methylase SpoU